MVLVKEVIMIQGSTMTEREAAIRDAGAKKGRKIRCRFCLTEFEHNGKNEFQTCPKCGTELMI